MIHLKIYNDWIEVQHNGVDIHVGHSITPMELAWMLMKLGYEVTHTFIEPEIEDEEMRA